MQLLYSDAQIAVCIKPCGTAAQGDAPAAMPSLLAAALGGTIYPVHRLDQAVGGVMVYARTKQAAAALSAAIQSGLLEKEYLAVLTRPPENPAGTLRDLLQARKQNISTRNLMVMARSFGMGMQELMDEMA